MCALGSLTKMPDPLEPFRDTSSRSMIRTDTPFAAKESARTKPVGPAPTCLEYSAGTSDILLVTHDEDCR
jgi:hypothetical protein